MPPGTEAATEAPAAGDLRRSVVPVVASLLGVAAVAATLAAAAHAGSIEVTVTVDGASRRVVSHAGTVADLLVEQRVPVRVGDLVAPELDSRLDAGAEVLVQRSRPVIVWVDGRELETQSHGRSARAVLEEVGVVLDPSDRVWVNDWWWPLDAERQSPPDGRRAPRLGVGVQLASLGPDWLGAVAPAHANALAAASAPDGDEGRRAAPNGGHAGGGAGRPSGPASDGPLPGGDSSWVIRVHRARPVTVAESGIPLEMALAGATIGDALEAAGVPLGEADLVFPSRDTPLEGVRQIRVERAVPFSIEISGGRTEVRAHAATVGEAVEVAGFTLGPADRVEPPADTPLEPGATVRIVRVDEQVLEEESQIPFSRVTQADPSLALDETLVLRAGEPGLKQQRIRVVLEDGAEVGREVIHEAIVREPVDEIVAYGTRIDWRTVDTPEGPKRYWRKLRVYATSYSLSRSGTPKSAPWYGYTRSGLPMRKGIVGINPRIIPWMTNLYVPGYGIGIAADTGGGIGTYHIDLGYDDDNYESWHWYVDAYLLEPLPPEDRMTWILP